LNNTSAVNPSCLFRGRVLGVKEPTEPSAVRWFQLSTGGFSRVIRTSITLACTVGMISFAGSCVAKTRVALGPVWSGVLVTGFNSTVPQIIKLLMIAESHSTEGSFQASLYLKITLFRWTLSAILPHVSVYSVQSLQQ
jgi:hypothetical protein